MSTSLNPRILITGITGFVGGSILATLFEAYPDIHVLGLVRKESQARVLQAAYPNLELVIGETTSLLFLKSTVKTVDFVVHAAGDDVDALSAMIDGLADRHADATPFKPCLISITGPRSLLDLAEPATGIADPNAHIWSDVDDCKAILSVPADRLHAGADQAIIEYSLHRRVGTMLVSPGQLWGRGKGIFKQESSSAMYYSVVKERGHAFVIGDGSIEWSWCSNRDLGRAVVFLMSQALFEENASSRVGVNEQGYYFVQAGDVSLKQRAEDLTKRSQGLGEIQSISVEAASKIHPFGPVMWGRGAIFRADRLRNLGWQPIDHDWRALMKEHGGQRA